MFSLNFWRKCFTADLFDHVIYKFEVSVCDYSVFFDWIEFFHHWEYFFEYNDYSITHRIFRLRLRIIMLKYEFTHNINKRNWINFIQLTSCYSSISTNEQQNNMMWHLLHILNRTLIHWLLILFLWIIECSRTSCKQIPKTRLECFDSNLLWN